MRRGCWVIYPSQRRASREQHNTSQSPPSKSPSKFDFSTSGELHCGIAVLSSYIFLPTSNTILQSFHHLDVQNFRLIDSRLFSIKASDFPQDNTTFPQDVSYASERRHQNPIFGCPANSIAAPVSIQHHLDVRNFRLQPRRFDRLFKFDCSALGVKFSIFFLRLRRACLGWDSARQL
ncbi:hypothetical protein C8R43DRAFT_1009118, partial [Mycena crocata]